MARPLRCMAGLRDFCVTSKYALLRFDAFGRCVGAAKSLISKTPWCYSRGYEPRGRGFESCQPHQIVSEINGLGACRLTRFFRPVLFDVLLELTGTRFV